MLVTETAAALDANGKEIPGSAEECFVVKPFPPGMSEADKRSRDRIKRACERAVYDQGLIEYGNKNLTVVPVTHDGIWSIPCERVTVTMLLAPDKAEQVRASNGRDLPAILNRIEHVEETDDEDDVDDADDDIQDDENES